MRVFKLLTTAIMGHIDGNNNRGAHLKLFLHIYKYTSEGYKGNRNASVLRSFLWEVYHQIRGDFVH